MGRLRTSMRLLAAAACLAVLGLQPPAANAASTELWPGVTYSRTVQFTSHGPVVLHVVSGPRPGGLTTLDPLLSNESVLGRETLTSMERRVTDGVTAGVNADFSRFDNGKLSGIFMRNSALAFGPNAKRSSVGIRTDGLLDVRRVAVRATWTGATARPLSPLNDAPVAGRAALYTGDYGPATPAIRGATAAVLFPFPVVTPDVDLRAPVVEVVTGGAAVPIPPGGAVLVGAGALGAAIAAEAQVGASVGFRFDFVPNWAYVVAAVGGGPELVRGGAAVAGADEWFTPLQLVPRAPRSAVGQLRNGRVILVAVDGRQPGYSTGLTNAELARAMVRLGAVRAMAFDSGGSTTVAFDGALLNRPSDGRERPIGSALVFRYAGVFVPPPPARVSPNGDGVDDTPNLGYRLYRPSSVTVTLRAPDGSTPVSTTALQPPGAYPVPFPGAAEAGAAGVNATAAAGFWAFDVKAIDDIGQSSAMTRTFVVDDTLGFLQVPKLRAVPPQGREIPIAFTLARSARVTVTVLDQAGRVVRGALAVPAARDAGRQQVTWDGLGANGHAIEGRFTVQVAATSSLGRSVLSSAITIRKTSAPRG